MKKYNSKWIRKKLSSVLILCMLFTMIGPAYANELNLVNEIEQEVPVIEGEILESIIDEISPNQTVFIPNKGQFHEEVAYKSSIPNGELFVDTSGELTYLLYFDKDIVHEEEMSVEPTEESFEESFEDPITFDAWSIKERFVGAITPDLIEKNPVQTEFTYIKNDNHVKNLKGYKKIEMSEIYDGVTLDLIVTENNVEKIFKLDKGVSPEVIQVQLDGANNLRINGEGQLEVDTDYGTVAFTTPIAYQDKQKKELIDVSYTLDGDTYGFSVSSYDPKKPLYIDPLIASSYIGDMSGYTYSRGISRDLNGDVIITGKAVNPSFPVTAGAYDTAYIAHKAFVSKFDQNITTLLASTYIGGTGSLTSDWGERIVVLPNNDIAIIGTTENSDFPVTIDVVDETYNGGYDMFISILNNDLSSLKASTYIGGTKEEKVGNVIYRDGYLYISGTSDSGSSFPVTPGDSRRTSGYTNPFIVKISEDLTDLAGSTLFGGGYYDESYDIALDDDGKVYIVGKTYYSGFPTTVGAFDRSYGGRDDGFVSKWSNDLVTLEASTLLGGGGYESASSIAVADNGDIYVGARSGSTDFPGVTGSYSDTLSGGTDATVTIFDKNLSTVKKSTFVGGESNDYLGDLKLDSAGNVILFGMTQSNGFPTTPDCFDDTRNGNDGFLSKLNRDLTELEFSTFIGGSDVENAKRMYIDDDDTVYITGETESHDFPTLPDALNPTFSSNTTGSYAMVIPRALSGFSAADYYAPFEQGSGTDPTVGAYKTSKQLLSVTGAKTVAFGVSYNAITIEDEGPMGYGWTHGYQTKLVDDVDSVEIKWNQYKSHRFEKMADGTYQPNLEQNPYDQLTVDESGYLLITKNKTEYTFDLNGILTNINDKTGQGVTLAHNVNGDVKKVTEDISGRFIEFSYYVDNRLKSVNDNMERLVSFTYDTNGDLEFITDAEERVTTYAYNGTHQIELITDNDSVVTTIIGYDADGRVTSIDDAEPSTAALTYSYDETTTPGKLVTTVTDPELGEKTITSNSEYTTEGVLDSMNQSTIMDYDDKRNVISATDAKGHITEYEYDANGNIKKVTDAKSNVTSFYFDSNNNLKTVTDADNKITSMTYDANNNLDLVTNAKNEVTDYDYDANSLLESVKLPRGGITSYQYILGQVKIVTNAAGNTRTYSYDLVGRNKTVMDGAGNITQFDYDNADNLLTITDALMNTQVYTYNAWEQPKTFKDANGFVTTYEYNDKYQLEHIKQTIDSVLQMTQFTYDHNGNIKTVTDAEGNIVTYDYDALNRRTHVTNALGKTVEFTYDEVGNLETVKDAKNVVVADYEYDAVGNVISVTDALSHETISTYNSLNLLKTTTDREGNLTKFNYDDLARMNSAVDALSNISSMDYDADGNRSSITDQNGNVTSFSYDLTGRLDFITADTGNKLDYSYNNRDLVENIINGRNQTTTLSYDALGRLNSLVDAVGTISYTHDGNGNVLTVTDASGTITRTYDDLNRVETYTDTFGNTITYSYDKVGNLETITYPDDKVVSYVYDSTNQLEKVTDWANRVTDYIYDPNGRLVDIIRSNGTTQTMVYDANGNMESLTDKDSSDNIINDYTLTMDKEGNITVEDRKGIETYTNVNDFDDIYRLTNQQENIDSVINTEYDYSYDAGGNMETIQMSDATTAGAIQVQTYGDANHLLTVDGETVVHDADGNMTSGPLNGNTETFTFDVRNRLTAVDTNSYTYNAENHRTSINEDGKITNYVIDANVMLNRVLMKTEGNVTTYYVYGLGLIGEETDGVYSTYHYDLRGSTIALTDDNGLITDTFNYGPYGELESRTGTTDVDYLYNGRDGVITDDNGLYYMRARYYNPEIKRFLKEDPYAGKYDNILNVNLFGYVSGNPINFVDPSGNKPYIFQVGDDGEFIFVADSRGINIGMSLIGLVPFGRDIIESISEKGIDIEFISKKDMANSIKNKTASVATALSLAAKLDNVKGLSKGIVDVGKTVGKRAGYLSFLITAVDGYNEIFGDSVEINQLVDNVFGNYIRSNTREEAIAKYTMLYGFVEVLVDNGSITYDTKWGNVDESSINVNWDKVASTIDEFHFNNVEVIDLNN